MQDSAITETLFDLLAQRAQRAKGAEGANGATLCPSEVARALAPHDWRPLMPEVRRVAAALAADGRLRVTRGGVEVDAQGGGGPIRLGRP